MNRIRAALRRQDGASSVEYGLLIGAIAAIIVLVVFVLGRVTKGQFTSTCSAWDTAEHTSQC
jgi:pilus assembly protein Flp/PilA